MPTADKLEIIITAITQDAQKNIDAISKQLNNLQKTTNNTSSNMTQSVKNFATNAAASFKTNQNPINSFVQSIKTPSKATTTELSNFANVISSGGKISVKNMASAFTGLTEGAALGGASLVGAIGAAAVGVGVAMAALTAPMAVDAMESENAFNVTIGRMRDQANALADDMYRLGQSPIETKNNVGKFYGELRGMGFNQNDAFKMSEDMVRRAYDVSSLQNIPVEQSMQMFQASMVGLNMRFRQIGIVITQEQVKQYAYAKGIAKVGSELNETQKAMASYGLAMQKTGYMAGDLEATQYSTANQLRSLKSQWDVFLITIGKGFEPFYNAIVRMANLAMPILQKLAEGFTYVANTIYKVSAGIGGAIGALMNGQNVTVGFANAWNLATEYINNYNEETKKRAEMAEQMRDATNAENEALKKQKKAVDDNIQSFDELHLIKNKDSGDGGGDGGGGTGLDGLNNPSGGNDKDKYLPIPTIPFSGMPSTPMLPQIEPVTVQINAVDNTPSVFQQVLGNIEILKALNPQSIGIWLQTNAQEIANNVNLAKQSILTYFGELELSWQALTQNANQFGLNIIQNFEYVKNTIGQLVTQLQFNTEFSFNNLFQNVTSSLGVFALNTEISFEALQTNAMSTINSFALNAEMAFQGAFDNIYVDVQNFALNTESSFETWKSNVYNTFSGFNTEVSGLVNSFVTATQPAIQTWSETAFTNMSSFVLNASKFFSEFFTSSATNFSLWAINTVSSIDQFILNSKTNLETWSSETSTNIASWINETSGNFALWASTSASAIEQFCSNGYTNLSGFLNSTATNIYSWAKSTISNIIDWAKSSLTTISELAGSVGQTISGSITASASILKNTFNAIGSWVADKKTAITTAGLAVTGTAIAAKAVEAIASGARAATGAVSGAVSSFIVPMYIPEEPSFTDKKKENPMMADGGIIRRRTNITAGEAGAEAIVPLENSSFINSFASAVGSAVLAGNHFYQTNNNNSSSKPVQINLSIDGQVFAKLTVPYIQKEEMFTSKPIIQMG